METFGISVVIGNEKFPSAKIDVAVAEIINVSGGLNGDLDTADLALSDVHRIRGGNRFAVNGIGYGDTLLPYRIAVVSGAHLGGNGNGLHA